MTLPEWWIDADRHEPEPEHVHANCAACGKFREVDENDRCAECAEGVE